MARKSNGESSSNRSACAPCKHQRRKCRQGCVLAPYFPVGKNAEYQAVHRVFGFSNMTKMLKNLEWQQREEAIKSFEWEALMWKEDPIHGPLGEYRKMQQQCEILRTQLKQENSVTQPMLMDSNQSLAPLDTGNNVAKPILMDSYQSLAPLDNGNNVDKPILMGSNQSLAPLDSGNNLARAVNNNWAILAPNNVDNGAPVETCNNGKISTSNFSVRNFGSHYANSFSDLMENEILESVQGPDDLNAMQILGQGSFLQQNQSHGSIALPPAMVSSSTMYQPIQVRGVTYNGSNKINAPLGLRRRGQEIGGRADANVLSNLCNWQQRPGKAINQRIGEAMQVEQGHGVLIQANNGVTIVAANATDHALAQTRGWCEIQDFHHHSNYDPLATRRERVQPEGHHGFQQNHAVQGVHQLNNGVTVVVNGGFDVGGNNGLP